MARKHIKKSNAKIPSPVLQQPVNKASSAAQDVKDRVDSGGKDYWLENAIDVMTDSAKLVQEPEFIDLAMNGEKAAEITIQRTEKYEKRLAAAQKKSQDELEELLDDVRIEIVAELTTPAFRRDVKNRLQAMIDRLMISEDLKRLESVLFLKHLLEIKDIPWGLCGLVLEIYDRTMQQMLEAQEAEIGAFDEVFEAFKDSGIDEINVNSLLKSPEKLEQIGEKIFEAKPGLRERAEKQVSDMVDAFEKELRAGKIKLDLFTEAELILPFQQFEAKFGRPVTEIPPSKELSMRLFDAVKQAINQMMTPKRYQSLVKSVKSTAKDWLRERKKMGGCLAGRIDMAG